MVDQVQELFGHVPRSLIVEDLEATNSVETTIDNILEGRLFQQDTGSSSGSESETADRVSTDEEVRVIEAGEEVRVT